MSWHLIRLPTLSTVPSPRPATAQGAICALSPSADAPFLAYPAPLPSPALAAMASNAASSISTAAAASATGYGLLFSTRALVHANGL
ncbi:hypothetical protein B0H13DRAFT_2303766 [Mycena leptocephala]|nr:hypothetical protein B0H13DRAFT_2303766 [Mycena leptocephala]